MNILGMIDSVLDRITMYRVVLYYLIAVLGIAVVYSFAGILPYDPFAICFSALFLIFFSEWVNDIFSKAFAAPVNVESTTITALILACIIAPVKQVSDFIPMMAIATVAIASKYMLAIRKKHIFNPVAIAVAASAIAFRVPAVWWVGNPYLALPVAVGGLLVIRKLRRESMVWTFFGTVFIVASTISVINGSSLPVLYSRLLLHSSVLYFAFVMLTEPQTLPPTKTLQIAYAAIVGFLFVPQIHVGSLYSTPELSLVAGNIFSYIVSPKDKLMVYAKEKILHATDTIDFIFSKPPGFTFIPGQYMEWTLPHVRPDTRGNRRYFTIASSPTENSLRLGIKFYAKSSSYKKALLSLSSQDPVIASQRAGEFIFPKDEKRKIVFVAGGIGITPYRSMVKYLLDTHQSRDIVLLYANKSAKDIIYQDIFEAARQQFALRTIYTLTDTSNVPAGWGGRVGRIDSAMIMSDIPDYRERLFYLSGPYSMVTYYERTLKDMGLPAHQIKKDFFPGLV